FARPCTDGDLLVHRRGGHARARLARPPLRALGRRGGGERRGDALPPDPSLPPLRREAPLRARLLGGLPDRAWRVVPRLRAVTHEATRLRYDERGHLSDMDAGFYSADYLRAWIRSAQLKAYLRREVGEDW